MRTVVYGYGDANWKDKMTSYDGQTITYDAIGNPLEYRDGMEFTWQNGRELAALHTPDGDASYTYNADGIRTRKQAGGQTTEYLLEGSRVIAESTGGDVIWYYYDSDGVRTAMEYEGDSYYYVYNLQGDVLGLIDEIGEVVVEYTYDSWGNILSVTGSMASTLGVDNPFRYRGYYYDEESGLYYLNSRYYDPVTGRFINADGVSLFAYDFTNMTQYNMFAYCFNNPINYYDPTGDFAIAIPALLGIIGTVAGITALFGLGVVGGILIGDAISNALTNVQLAKPSKKTGKETANDKPSWVNKGMVDPSLPAEENARRLLNKRYGPGNWKKGPGSEFNQIKKWLTRALNLKSLAPGDSNDDNIIVDEWGNVYIIDMVGDGFGWVNGVYRDFLC